MRDVHLKLPPLTYGSRCSFFRGISSTAVISRVPLSSDTLQFVIHNWSSMEKLQVKEILLSIMTVIKAKVVFNLSSQSQHM